MTFVRRAIVVAGVFAICGTSLAGTPRAKALARELFKMTRGAHGPSPLYLMSVMGPALEPGSDEARQLKTMEKKVEEYAEDEAVQLYSLRLSESHLEQLIAFFKTEPGLTFIQLGEQFASGEETIVHGLVLRAMKEAVNLSKLRRTMADLKTLGAAAQAFATQNGHYPPQKSMLEFAQDISPFFASPPQDDAWDTQFRYYLSADKKTYRLVSAGPDQIFDTSSRMLNEKLLKSDDLVYQNGKFLQSPNFD